MISAHRLAGRVLPAAAIVAACVTACSTPQSPAGDPQDLAGTPSTSSSGTMVADSARYSLTQTINNTSSVNWTVLSAVPDNGGQMTPGYPTQIKANTSGTFVATNTGNGVQLTITLSGDGGQTLIVDSDVPKVNNNWTKDSVTGPGASSLNLVGTGGPIAPDPNSGSRGLAIGNGKTPQATAVVQACSQSSPCSQQNYQGAW